MYTILLTDDEDSVLEILKASINWQELGVDTLLTASDGQAALDLFEQRQIDLLVTDIRMPRMDGLELIRQVRKLSPETHCILLTAYGEFEYAKQAISLGVENYLLKPVAKEEVEQNIRNALNNIYKNRHSSEKLLLENTLRRWVGGAISDEELSDRATVLGINLYQRFYCVVCLVKKKRGSMAVLRAACVEVLQKEYDVSHFWDEKGRYVIILGGSVLEREVLAGKVTELVKKTGTESIAAVAIGTPVTQADHVRLSYQAACESIELADLQNSGVILPGSAHTQSPDADLLAEEICILFYIRDGESRNNGFRHLAHKLGKNVPVQEIFARLAQGCLYILVNEFPGEEGLQARVYHDAAPDSWPAQPEDTEEAVLNFLQAVYEIFSDCFAKYTPVVQRTILYIRDGVLSGESVSLKEFCGQNGMNPAYLGHTFKAETGTFFNDYLTRCRVERAIILLCNPQRMIKDIAEEVGFAYTSYFVKCFRDQKGVSPAKYRQDLLDHSAQRGM